MPRARRVRPSPAAGRTPTPCWPGPPAASRDRRIRARGPTARRRGRGRSGRSSRRSPDPGRPPGRRSGRPRARSSSGGRPRSRECPIRARSRRPATRARRPDPPRGRTRPPPRPARPPRARSSPSAANRPERSRCFRAWSLRISLSFSLWGLVIISSGNKKGGLHLQAAREVRMEPSRLSRDGLPG